MEKNIKSLYEKIMKDKNFLEDKIKEMNTTGNVAGYNTPNAFTKSGKPRTDNTPDEWEKIKDEDIEKVSLEERLGLPKKTNINEEEENMTPKKKVNLMIKEINRRIYELDRCISKTVRLKTESGINQDKYWKSTVANVGKIRERLNRIGNKIHKFGE